MRPGDFWRRTRYAVLYLKYEGYSGFEIAPWTIRLLWRMGVAIRPLTYCNAAGLWFTLGMPLGVLFSILFTLLALTDFALSGSWWSGVVGGISSLAMSVFPVLAFQRGRVLLDPPPCPWEQLNRRVVRSAWRRARYRHSFLEWRRLRRSVRNP